MLASKDIEKTSKGFYFAICFLVPIFVICLGFQNFSVLGILSFRDFRVIHTQREKDGGQGQDLGFRFWAF
jgi:hypothetical protein